MEKVVASATLQQDPLGRELIDYLDTSEAPLHLNGAVLYYDFPIFRDYDDDLYKASLLLVSPRHGLVAIHVANLTGHTDPADYLSDADVALSQFEALLFSRLIKSPKLRQTRQGLRFPINPCLYVIDSLGHTSSSRHLEHETCASLEGIFQFIAKSETPPLDPEILDEIRSIIEGAKAIARPRPRDIAGDKSRSATLAALEAEIANFDANQRKVAISLLNGPQRIRGLAGSGKTIVLAMKAAHMHLVDPEQRILFTFYTRSLYTTIKRLITRFYRHYKDEDPDWDTIQLLHGWGARNLPGVYSSTARAVGLLPISFRDAQARSFNPFDYVCSELLKSGLIRPVYDAILIDEAQDFPNSFFQLCYNLAHGDRDEKTIIWAYDELQNIFDVKTRSSRELFGTDSNGTPLLDLERAARNMPNFMSNDVILYKCYRNPREVLVTAHSLGFGLYSDTIVQMLENKEHWEDVGYVIEEGEFTVGSDIVAFRPADNSPLSLSKYEKPDQIIVYKGATDLREEVGWVVQQISEFVAEGLKPHDIMVISLDDRNARSYFSVLTSELSKISLEVNDLLGNPFNTTEFVLEERITLSTVYRAKGNEAPVVFAMGLDALLPLRRSRIARNRIFTAFTRAKAWLRVSGIQPAAAPFFAEIDRALENFPRLRFTYPDPDLVETIQRDMSERAIKIKESLERFREEMREIGVSDDEIDELFVAGAKK
jgi:superfamily I DNA and RNA helicase